MDEIQKITWFAGLFEGEGTFTFAHGKPKRLAISMTDKDVLDRVQEFFGGSVAPLAKRQEHWKDAWVWTLHGSNSVELTKKIIPYLGVRRAARGNEFVEKFSTMANRKQRATDLANKVKELRKQNLTHREIADRLDIDRTYVTHILNR